MPQASRNHDKIALLRAAAAVSFSFMAWSAIDQLLFASHLRGAQSAIETALGELGFDALIVAAGLERLAFQDDQSYPFRPNPWFTWLVPSPAAPASLVECRPGRMPRLVFSAPQDFWHSPPDVPDASWIELFSLEVLREKNHSVSLLDQSGKVAWLGEEQPPLAHWESNPPALIARLEQARCRKSPWELANLREATRTAVAGHRAAERAFRAGAAEFDINLAFLSAVRQPEPGLPYPPIIALNEHAAVLHYQHRHTRAPARALSLLIDAGTSCRGYASDITRTWAMGPGLFATLVEGMHALQKSLCESVKPGADWRELHLQAHWLIARLLQETGILRLAPDDAVSRGISAAFLPHGLGHLLGLQVHDVGGFSPAAGAAPIPRPPGHPALRLTRPLQPGMVVTVEPGLYFIDSLLAQLKSGPHADAVDWPLVERLAPFGGIRIEDNVVVTEGGHENLTRAAFADVG
jgi:Xaa-Pro dipeptidase